MTRNELTEKIIELKRRNKLTWKEIAKKIGPGSEVYYTAALHGQMKVSKEEAENAARALVSTKTRRSFCRKHRIAALCQPERRPIR